MSHTTIGELLRRHRADKLGVSVREAADLVGVHYTYLSRIENDISEPSDEVLNKVVASYKLSDEEAAELFWAVRVTPSFSDALNKISERKAVELMFRKKKK